MPRTRIQLRQLLRCQLAVRRHATDDALRDNFGLTKVSKKASGPLEVGGNQAAYARTTQLRQPLRCQLAVRRHATAIVALRPD